MSGRFLPRPRPTATPRPSPPTATLRWTPPFDATDLALVTQPLRRGPQDPAYRRTATGTVWRCTRTPQGPGTLRLRTGPGDRDVHADAWGPGAAWLLDTLPTLLGTEDDPTAFEPRHRLLATAAHRRPGLRLARTGLVMESLIPSILEQKVTTDEAYRAWRRLLHQHGEPAPGAPPELGMYVLPEPRAWSLIPSWDWHRAGVDHKRSSTILRAVRVARRLEEAAAMSPEDAAERLQLVPGIGPWTAAETVQRSHGAPDAVTTGDLHLPGIVGYALANEREADDARMLELLEPYAGQRHRAARLILLSGRTPPRRQPKMPKTDIALL